jgi:hypothetical protein
MEKENLKGDKKTKDNRNPENYRVVEIYEYWRLSEVEIIELRGGIPHMNHFNMNSEYGRKNAKEEFDFVFKKNRFRIRKIRLTRQEKLSNRNWLEDGLKDDRPPKTKVIRWLKFAFFRLLSWMEWPLYYLAKKINDSRQRRNK